jgi:hypothetical protein
VTPLSAVSARSRPSAVLRPVDIASPTDTGTVDDRRVHTRHSFADLTWLNEARLKYGPTVALIDLSAGGAQIEISSYRLQPGTRIVFELSGRDRTVAIPASVLRAQVAGITPHTTYRAALEFKRTLDLDVSRPATRAEEEIDVVHEHARLALTLRRLYESTGGSGNRIASATAAEAAITAALAATQAACAHRADNPLARHMGRLLRVLTNGIASGAAAETMVAHTADCLKRIVPTRAVKLIRADAPLIHSADAVHFAVPSPNGGAPDHLLVEFPRGCHLEPWQLQFLKTAAQLLAVIGEADRLRSTPDEVVAVPSGWHRVVVRYLDGQIVKGFCDEFSPSTGQVPVCPAPNAPRESRILISLKQLKAVFFVHDLEGGASRQGPQNARESGRRIDVTFADGELLSGTTLSYTRDGAGFFVYPTDAHSNNSRTYVMAAAVRHVQFP